MADFGLLLTGFVIKTEQDLRTQINSSLQAKFGASFDVSDGSAAGEVAGIMAGLYGELWELSEQVNSNSDPNKATDTGLDAVCAVTGTLRLNATSSVVTVTVTGTPATSVLAPFRVATLSTAAAFTTATNSTLILLASWAPTTVYATGARVTNASRAYQALIGGTSAGSGGPTSQALSIVDGGVTWEWIGDGTAAADILAAADVTGPVVATARDLTDIRTPVGGVQNATNLANAIPGRNRESDPDLRVRREEELAGVGAGTAANIRALLLKIVGVTAAHVFVNDTDVTDADGVPPHAVEALVQGGATQDIVDLLGEEVASGIVTVGTTSGTHVDSEGTSISISFSRPTEIDVAFVTHLTEDASTYTGDTDVSIAIAAYGAAEQVIGKDVVPGSVAAVALPVRVNGVRVAGVTGVLKIVDALVYTDTIGTASAWLPTTAYSATPTTRSVVTNDGRSYICITAGTSAGSGGPTGTATDITDGSVHWRFLGADIPISARQIAVITAITVISSSATP